MGYFFSWLHQIFSLYSDWDRGFGEVISFVLNWNWDFSCVWRSILMWSVIRLIRSVYWWVGSCHIILWRCYIWFSLANFWCLCWFRRRIWWGIIINRCMILCSSYISFYCSKVCRNLFTFLNNYRLSRFNFCLDNSFITCQGNIHSLLLRIISIHFNFHITIAT